MMKLVEVWICNTVAKRCTNKFHTGCKPDTPKFRLSTLALQECDKSLILTSL